MKLYRIFLPLFFMISCNVPKVFYDYDEQVNFSDYTTYNIFPDLNTGLSELDEGRLLTSLQSEFTNKGIIQGATPDFLINIYSEEFHEPNRNSIGLGVGSSGRNIGVGISGGIPIGRPETILSLTFDIVSAQEDDLIWQAVVESKFDRNASPEKRKAIFDKMVKKALEGYPPKSQ